MEHRRPKVRIDMVKLITMCRGPATVLAILFWLGAQHFAAQKTLGQMAPLALPALVGPQEPESLPPPPDAKLPAPPQTSEDLDDAAVDVLMRGPVHEAFAEVHQNDPAPSPLVERQPPEPIDEVPPEFKPDGRDVQWIAGYWAWDDGRNDFVWVSGGWRDVPKGRRWEPGYWHAVEGGFRRVSGYWAEVEPTQLGYLPNPPASIESGPSYAAPSADHYYVPGYWTFQSNTYRWRPGYWVPRVSDWVYIPARYYWTPHGCVFRSGYWDRLLSARGWLYAPICFDRSAYVFETYRYRPSYLIQFDYDFLVHLFVHPSRSYYCFGDWYGVQHLGRPYYPWVDYHHYRGHYDPLLSYYRYAPLRYQDTTVFDWLYHQHRIYASDHTYRPRHTHRDQIRYQQKTHNRQIDTHLKRANYLKQIDDLVHYKRYKQELETAARRHRASSTPGSRITATPRTTNPSVPRVNYGQEKLRSLRDQQRLTPTYDRITRNQTAEGVQQQMQRQRQEQMELLQQRLREGRAKTQREIRQLGEDKPGTRNLNSLVEQSRRQRDEPRQAQLLQAQQQRLQQQRNFDKLRQQAQQRASQNRLQSSSAKARGSSSGRSAKPSNGSMRGGQSSAANRSNSSNHRSQGGSRGQGRGQGGRGGGKNKGGGK